jgi:hypothetical protein
MFQTLSNAHIAALTIAILILAVFSFQYPVSMSAPLGGDVQTHIQVARYPFEAPPYQIASQEDALRKSRYPLAAGMFAATRILPLSWENRFMVWMALGHIAAGLAIGLVAFRIAGPWAAALAMVFWAIATMGVLPFFRAGTMPQLWSMPFLLLFLERLLKRSLWWSVLPLIATYYTHPATFAVAALSLALAAPALFVWRYVPRIPWQKTIVFFSTAVIASGILSLFMIFPERFPFATFSADEPWHDLLRLLHTQLGPVFLLAPFGIAAVASAKHIPLGARIMALTFGVISMILAINNSFGGAVPEKRLLPYAMAAAAVFGAVGLHHLLTSHIANSWTGRAIAAGIVAALVWGGWNTTKAFYVQYDTCDISAPCPTMTTAEREAYEWMDVHLHSDAVVAVQENRQRATEWIPVIANRGLAARRFSGGGARAAAVLTGSCEEVVRAISRTHATHAAFYKLWDEVPEAYFNNEELFPLLYENEEVLVFAFPDKEILSDLSAGERDALCQQ